MTEPLGGAPDNQTAAVEFFRAVPALYQPDPVPMGSVGTDGRPIIPRDSIDGDSAWWIERLLRSMRARETRLTQLRAYYRGEQQVWRLTSEAFRMTFGRAFHDLKANLAKLVVQAPEQRLLVQGFRVPLDPATNAMEAAMEGEAPEEEAGEADEEAWRIWQANGMDSRSRVAHIEALVMGECPVLVQPDPDDPHTPRITVEDPLQVHVELDPVDSRKRRAALKRWTDDDGSTALILYLPDRIEWWRGTHTSGAAAGYRAEGPGRFTLAGTTWTLDPLRSGPPKVAGVVPVVPLVNMPRVDGTGESEFEAVMPLFDMINKTLLDLVTTMEFTAAPQRWAVGVQLDEDTEVVDDSGNTTRVSASPIVQAVNRWNTSDSPDAKFGQFPVADLTPYGSTIDKVVQLIGSITFTPYHFLLNMPSAVPATGEALKSAEVSLVAKAERHQTDFGEGWEEVMRLAFLTAGDAPRATTLSEVIWAPAESRTLAQLADALVKLGSLGVPTEKLWELWGFSPQEIERFRAMRLSSPPVEAPVRVTEPVTPATVDQATGPAGVDASAPAGPKPPATAGMPGMGD